MSGKPRLESLAGVGLRVTIGGIFIPLSPMKFRIGTKVQYCQGSLLQTPGASWQGLQEGVPIY